MKSDRQPPRSSGTGRRLGALLLAYLGAVVAVITLAPFEFGIPQTFRMYTIVRDGGWATDVVLNIALFVPLGLIWHRTTGHSIATVACAAVVASAGIESAQLFLAPRFSTMSDIAANASGAAIGAAISHLVDRRIGQGHELVGRLLLDLPLMGVVYLLVPLLWLDGLAAYGDPSRLWLLLPLAIAGSLALSAVAGTVQVAGSPFHRRLVGSAVAWFAVGAVPALRVSFTWAVGGLIVSALAVEAGRRIWEWALHRDRRLEPQVVRVLVPLLLLYIGGLAAERDGLAFGEGGDARVSILRGLEVVAAYTVLGYLAAEWRGRRRESWARMMALPLTLAVAVAAATTLLWPTVWSGILTAAAASAIGATLYRHQRDHLLALIEARDATG